MPALVHPVALLALALWLVNDHIGKAAFPGFVTGKLSDVAGMIVAPLVLAAIGSAVIPRAARLERALPWGAFVVVAIVFAAVKTSTNANELWRDAATAARAPLHALAVHLRGAPFSERVILVRDPTDLVGVPFGLVAARIACRSSRRDPPPRPRASW